MHTHSRSVMDKITPVVTNAANGLIAIGKAHTPSHTLPPSPTQLTTNQQHHSPWNRRERTTYWLPVTLSRSALLCSALETPTVRAGVLYVCANAETTNALRLLKIRNSLRCWLCSGNRWVEEGSKFGIQIKWHEPNWRADNTEAARARFGWTNTYDMNDLRIYVLWIKINIPTCKEYTQNAHEHSYKQLLLHGGGHTENTRSQWTIHSNLGQVPLRKTRET